MSSYLIFQLNLLTNNTNIPIQQPNDINTEFRNRSEASYQSYGNNHFTEPLIKDSAAIAMAISFRPNPGFASDDGHTHKHNSKGSNMMSTMNTACGSALMAARRKRARSVAGKHCISISRRCDCICRCSSNYCQDSFRPENWYGNS